MTDQVAQEPTMEEILASIRRIISEDDAPAGEAPAPAAESPAAEALAAPPTAAETEDDDVLDLTQPMDAADDILAPAPEPAAAPEVRSADVETLGDLDAYIAPPAAKPAAQEPAPMPRPVPTGSALANAAGIIGERTAASVSSAFGQLSSALQVPADGRTLEDVVRDLLQPLLKDWLDTNLPRIVEGQVAEELERLSRQRR